MDDTAWVNLVRFVHITSIARLPDIYKSVGGTPSKKNFSFEFARMDFVVLAPGKYKKEASVAWRLCQAQRLIRLKYCIYKQGGKDERSKKRERKFKLGHPLTRWTSAG